MTSRDAFVLGVIARCKTAELDSDDTIALVNLLLSDPKMGTSIVKRAKADPGLKPVVDRLVKEAGKWGRRIGGFLGAGLGTAGGILASALTGGVGAVPMGLAAGSAGYGLGTGIGDWLGGSDSPAAAPAAAAASASAPQVAAQQVATPSFSQGELDWLTARGFNPAGQAAGRIPGTVWGGGGGPWGGSQHVPPTLTRTMSPGGAPSPGVDPSLSALSDKHRQDLLDNPVKEHVEGVAPPDRPYATQGKYLSGLTGQTDKQYATGIDWANQRKLSGRALRRQLRQLGLSFGHAENMTPEQMARAKYSPEVISQIQAAKEYRAQQSAATGGRPITGYGTGTGTPGTTATNPAQTAATEMSQAAQPAGAPPMPEEGTPEWERAKGDYQINSWLEKNRASLGSTPGAAAGAGPRMNWPTSKPVGGMLGRWKREHPATEAAASSAAGAGAAPASAAAGAPGTTAGPASEEAPTFEPMMPAQERAKVEADLAAWDQQRAGQGGAPVAPTGGAPDTIAGPAAAPTPPVAPSVTGALAPGVPAQPRPIQPTNRTAEAATSATPPKPVKPVTRRAPAA